MCKRTLTHILYLNRNKVHVTLPSDDASDERLSGTRRSKQEDARLKPQGTLGEQFRILKRFHLELCLIFI